MITKAFVEDIIDGYSVKVRIPLLDRIATAVGATDTDHLNVSAFTTIPGLTPILSRGDVVVISIDPSDDAPIIIGCLFCQKNQDRYKNEHPSLQGTFSSINVTDNVKLSANTTIGEVTPDEIHCLSGLDGNVQEQLTDILLRLKAVEDLLH